MRDSARESTSKKQILLFATSISKTGRARSGKGVDLSILSQMKRNELEKEEKIKGKAKMVKKEEKI